MDKSAYPLEFQGFTLWITHHSSCCQSVDGLSVIHQDVPSRSVNRAVVAIQELGARWCHVRVCVRGPTNWGTRRLLAPHLTFRGGKRYTFHNGNNHGDAQPVNASGPVNQQEQSRIRLSRRPPRNRPCHVKQGEDESRNYSEPLSGRRRFLHSLRSVEMTETDPAGATTYPQ